VILKSYIAEKNIELFQKYQSILIYGENDGIKTDLRNILKKNKDQKTEIINLFQEEIIKNNDSLYNHIFNNSLFSSNKIIFIHEATDKIFNLILECIDKPRSETKIFIFSGILDKKSKLRNHYDKQNNLASVACYEDNERTLINYINTLLKDIKGITPEIINLIMTNSSLDRKVISSEIEKIKTFASNNILKKIDVMKLINIKQSKDFDEIRDASLLGNKIKVNLLLDQIQFNTEDFMFYLNNMISRVSRLLEIKNTNNQNEDDEVIMENLKPKIFWKDKPIYLMQLKKWNIDKLESILNRLGRLELMIKKNSHIKSEILFKSMLISICLDANKSF
jgi:DNA polymerase-3 subunit delta